MRYISNIIIMVIEIGMLIFLSYVSIQYNILINTYKDSTFQNSDLYYLIVLNYVVDCMSCLISMCFFTYKIVIHCGEINNHLVFGTWYIMISGPVMAACLQSIAKYNNIETPETTQKKYDTYDEYIILSCFVSSLILHLFYK